MIPNVIRLGLLLLMLSGLLPAAAQERAITLAAPENLVSSGFLKFILPRFSLKNGVRVTIVAPTASAQVVLGQGGQAVFTGQDQTYGLQILEDTAATAKFAAWIGSDAGMRAITGFKRDGAVVFGPPQAVVVETVAVTLDGDARAGEELAFGKCGRCHVVGARNRMAGIGSTPSFAVLKTFDDWQDRFANFYILKPHPSFTQIAEVTPPFNPAHPPAISPIELTLEELENLLSFVASIAEADLGAPIKFQ